MEKKTPMHRLADALLEQPVEEFIRQRRAMPNPRSWRLIARDLFQATEGEVDVTYETLRHWSTEPYSPTSSPKAVAS